MIRRRELEDIEWLLSAPRGRRLLWRVFGITGIFRNSLDGSSRTFFNEGMRAIGTTLFRDMMESSPATFATMQAEAREQDENDERLAQIAREESDG